MTNAVFYRLCPLILVAGTVLLYTPPVSAEEPSPAPEKLTSSQLKNALQTRRIKIGNLQRELNEKKQALVDSDSNLQKLDQEARELEQAASAKRAEMERLLTENEEIQALAEEIQLRREDLTKTRQRAYNQLREEPSS